MRYDPALSAHFDSASRISGNLRQLMVAMMSAGTWLDRAYCAIVLVLAPLVSPDSAVWCSGVTGIRR